jgi:tetratricopeptide (TPR) repeat protein
MGTVTVQHVPNSKPPSFTVSSDAGAVSQAVEVPSPYEWAIEASGGASLMAELRWYLEDYHRYPKDPYTRQAGRLLEALREWGTKAFEALFDGLDAGHADVRVQSNDPAVLSWPWEALRARGGECLCLSAALSRSTAEGTDDAEPPAVARDRLNVLLVTARPYPNDVPYLTIARPLVELAQRNGQQIHVRVLRPPRFAAFEHHLGEHPGFYDVLQLDVHGGFGEGGCGAVVFENRTEGPDEIAADRLGEATTQAAIPLIVLNACRSGMIAPEADDPTASVALGLLEAGVETVVAMAYNLHASGARLFVPAFYGALLTSGDAAQSVSAGRQAMRKDPSRLRECGRYDLEDYVIPVLYRGARRQPPDPGERAARATPPRRAALPTEADEGDDHGFVGRSAEVLELERARVRKEPALLLTGLSGAGKTALARFFVRWVRDTSGPDAPLFWFRFREGDIRSAEYVINSVVAPILGTDALAQPMERRIDALAGALNEVPGLIVWDNFEVVAGLPEAHIEPTFPEEDRGVLLRLLGKLRGGRTKVLVTSRTDEEWLRDERCPVEVGGLQGEDRWQFCERVVGQFRLRVDRDDPDLVALMDLLGGIPLAMHAVLPQLQKRSAKQVLRAVRSDAEALGPAPAAIGLTIGALPAGLRPLLILLAEYEQYADAEHLLHMARQVHARYRAARVSALFRALTWAGAVRGLGQNVFELHPVLTVYLRTRTGNRARRPRRQPWLRAFVGFMAGFADDLAPRELHEQRAPFALLGGSFRRALDLAPRLGMAVAERALTQSLAGYALNTMDYAAAATLYTALAKLMRTAADELGEAVAYGQLGNAAFIRGDLGAAEEWYLKALPVFEHTGDEPKAAATYHQLGMLAQERGDLEAAEQWYLQSLAISERLSDDASAAYAQYQLGTVAQRGGDPSAAHARYLKAIAAFQLLGDEPGAAATYQQLGTLTQERGDLEAAEEWYVKALAIRDRLGNEPGAAITYNLLGVFAQERGDLDAAEQWYLRSLAIGERFANDRSVAYAYGQLGTIAQHRGDPSTSHEWYLKALAAFRRVGHERDTAVVCHQLGIVGQMRGELDAAEAWYQEALAGFERTGAEQDAAATYHQLGMVAADRRNFDAAEQWYLKSLAIKERLGNERAAAQTYHQLGMVAEDRRNLDAAKAWYLKSLAILERLGDEPGAAQTHHELGIVALLRGDPDAAEESFLKSLAICERLGDEPGAAKTYHQLGWVAQERRDLDAAGAWYMKSLAIKERLGDEPGAAKTYHQLGIAAHGRGDLDAAEEWYLKSLAIKECRGDEHGAAQTYHQLGNVAQLRGDLDTAEAWYRRALPVFERTGDELHAAMAQAGLALAKLEEGLREEAAAWSARALPTLLRRGTEEQVQGMLQVFGTAYAQADAATKERLHAMWEEAGLGDFPFEG